MIGDPTRARMLAHLLGSEHATAGELAHASGITPQTASAHLAKLVESELVALWSNKAPASQVALKLREVSDPLVKKHLENVKSSKF